MIRYLVSRIIACISVYKGKSRLGLNSTMERKTKTKIMHIPEQSWKWNISSVQRFMELKTTPGILTTHRRDGRFLAGMSQEHCLGRQSGFHVCSLLSCVEKPRSHSWRITKVHLPLVVLTVGEHRDPCLSAVQRGGLLRLKWRFRYRWQCHHAHDHAQ